MYLYCACPYINSFAIGTLQNELRQNVQIHILYRLQGSATNAVIMKYLCFRCTTKAVTMMGLCSRIVTLAVIMTGQVRDIGGDHDGSGV